MMEMVWKTVLCSSSSMREAALSELGSTPRLGVDSCVGGSETRSTAGTRDCLNAIRQILRISYYRGLLIRDVCRLCTNEQCTMYSWWVNHCDPVLYCLVVHTCVYYVHINNKLIYLFVVGFCGSIFGLCHTVPSLLYSYSSTSHCHSHKCSIPIAIPTGQWLIQEAVGWD